MRAPRRRVPDCLTVVAFLGNDMRVEEDCGSMTFAIREDGRVARIKLSEEQVKRVRARIEKYFRDNK